MKHINLFGVATLYAEELIDTCIRLGIDFQSINNLAETDLQVPHMVFDFEGQAGPCVVAPASPRARAEAARMAFKLGATSFGNLVDPSSRVAGSVTLGCGNYVNAMSTIGAATRIGCHCNVNRSASVGHHNQIGSFSSIGPGAVLAGVVSVGIGTLIGAGAVVLPKIKVGSNSVVGAGAVVTKDVADHTVVVGNPARPVGTSEAWTGLEKCPIC